MKKLFPLLVLCLLLAGCTQNPSKMGHSEAQAVDKLTYVKDTKTGVCYAVVASRGTGEAHQNGLSITYVPCTPEVEAQIEK